MLQWRGVSESPLATSDVPSPDTAGDEQAFDGDPSWRVTRELQDGTLVTIRPVTPDDREELRRGILELSPQSSYFRFLRTGTVPSDELLTYLTDVDQKDHVAIGAAIATPDLKSERGVGIARFVRLASPATAEAAVTVADDMQRRGVGRVLLRELLRAAQARQIRTIRAEVLADNEHMRSILARTGAQEVPEESGDGTIAYDIAIPCEQEPTIGASILEILRGAAETMALRFRRLSLR